MADSLTQEVQHPQIEVILLDLSIADLEIVEERYDEGDEWLLVVEVEVVGVGIHHRNDLGEAFLPGDGETSVVSLFV